MSDKPKSGKTGIDVDADAIRTLAELLHETDLTEIEVERDGFKLRVARNVTVQASAAPAHAPQPAASAGRLAPSEGEPRDWASHPGAVASPMVGTAYLAAEPGAAAFVQIGSEVQQGQTLLIIEAMKTMNHIPAPRRGRVTQILVANAQPIEYGEPLVVIE